MSCQHTVLYLLIFFTADILLFMDLKKEYYEIGLLVDLLIETRQ